MQQVTMVNCYRHIIESTESSCGLVEGSRDTLFQLNKGQCQILTKELAETCNFLDQRRDSLKFRGGVGCISLQQLCGAVKRAELLVKKCCCKDSESWLVGAMMLVEILEEFMVVILDLHLWRMFVDFAISCGKGLPREKRVEEVQIMDENYHRLFKDLRRENHALQQAAAKDKEAIISRTSTIAKTHGWTSGLQYLRAIYLKSWLTCGEASKDVELTKSEHMDTLGHGACGMVNKVKWLGVECALKILGGKDEKEATALKGLFHPNIIRLLHHWEDRPQNPRSCLLMELMPTNLHDYMEELLTCASSLKMQNGKDGVPFPLPVAIDIMYQIAQAMRYMHGKHLTHRDLKPANILVKERPKVDSTCFDGVGYVDIKLADFGLAKKYIDTSSLQPHSGSKGTGCYRAPEMFGKDMAQERHYLPMVDVWSFGITCVEILTGKDAYVEYIDQYGCAIQNMIKDKGLRPTLPKHCPEYLAFCITSCWQLVATRRPTFANLCKLLRHAKLMSLGVTNLNDSKVFFAYPTRSNQMNNMPLPPSSSKLRITALFQSSLKLVGVGSRSDPNIAEVSPEAGEVRLDPTPLIIEESPEPNEDIAGETTTPERLPDKVPYYPAVLPAADIVREKGVVAIGNGISPVDASNSIQPVNISRAVGKTMPKTGQDAEVKAVGNLQTQRSREKNKMILRWRRNFQDWRESRSDEEDLRILLRIVDAPKRVVEGPRDQAASSSSPGDLNIDSARSYHNTKPSPNILHLEVMGVKSAVSNFAKVLIAKMSCHPVEYGHLKETILEEVKGVVDTPNHEKFLVQAFICKRMFDGFDSPNGCFGIEHFEFGQMSKIVSFADFCKFKEKEATISMLLDSDSPDGSILGRFCFKKFKSITGEPARNQPFPICQEEWYAVDKGRHPNTVFYQSFLKVALSVWLVHRLVHSFEEKVDTLIYEKGSKFQRQIMESVVPGSYEEEDEESDGKIEVGFSVIPGFQVNGSVVKCEVYLRSKNEHTGTEITGQTSAEKAPGKSFSAKASMKLHIPEVTVSNSNSPQSLQSFDGSPDYAIDEGHGNDSNSRYQQERSGHGSPGSHDGATSVFYLEPHARSLNNRSLHYVARDTKTSEMRRLATARQSPK